MTTPTPLVTGVDFVTLAAGNFDAAVEFYGTVLDLPCSARYGRVHGAEFETGNLTIFNDPNGNTLMIHHRYAPRNAD
jgi:catechol 2,3-dioxygenase-like lactoylglutathione lyase family enzyme